ncbi:FtsW/RodA/SpoVE family cell cycle protein [Anaerocolumna chitinilytica]|uniref:Probable peptidoglycan glycosyltransferase FtsW n=1 Tax=Anaerocolumna chitinilytica TaxID=1727145 RepID=A0A7I8DR03_9FIRM|nr:FtsW/RodA/SpoVE family cell cycle protein [Anaerocolumna chitinilytica]BCJ99744.1 rod shape-determining protein RodA [Anaerocolumna chitinilytica]
MFPFKKYSIKNYDFSLLTLVLVLSVLGIYLVRIAQEGLFLKQIMGLALGLMIVAVVSMIDYHFISQFYIVLYFINLILLVAVRLFGVEHHSSRRWLDFKVFEFQPSELTKIILIIFMARLLMIFKDKMKKFYVLLLTGVLMGIPTFLILIQTNLSTSLVILFIFAIMIFAGGLSLKVILPILLTVIPIIIGTLWGIQNNYDIFFLTDYQQNRIEAFMNPESDQSSAALYQQENSVEVIGSGKLTGKLFSEGKDAIQSDTYVPISESDFIFSVAGESLGFIGGLVIIMLLSIIIFKCLIIASHAPDRLGRLIAIGISAMFVFQMFVNIGVATKLLPNTGIPLPFVSYGLSSMMSSMIAIGIIININLQRKFRRG